MIREKRPQGTIGTIIVPPNDGKNRRKTKCLHYRPCDGYCAKKKRGCTMVAHCEVYEEKNVYKDDDWF